MIFIWARREREKDDEVQHEVERMCEGTVTDLLPFDRRITYHIK